MSVTGKSVLVIGAGPAGLAAAVDLKEQGLEVHLVEKSDHPGGKAFDWSCMATDTCENCGACLSAELVEKVGQLDRVHIHCNSQLKSIARINNGFDVTLTGSPDARMAVDAVLLATGFTPFDPSVLKSLGYGKLKGVITTADLNELLKTGRLNKLLPKDRPPAIAFIQCVGSRNRKLGRDYCSQVCCKISLRHANKLLNLYPDADLTIFHMDLQVIGKQFRSFCKGLAGRIKFIQGTAAEAVFNEETGNITLYHEGQAINDRIAKRVDLVVLSIGMGVSQIAEQLPGLLNITPDAWGFVSQADETLPEGVYAAGTVRGPMDILQSIQQGRVAAAAIVKKIIVNPTAANGSVFNVAVVGGGAEAGRVADGIAAQGFPVVLIDPQNTNPPANTTVRYIANAVLSSVEGVAGRYRLRLSTDQGDIKEHVGAIVLANGSQRMPLKQEPILSLDGLSARETESLPQSIAFWLDYSGPEWKDNAAQVLTAAHNLIVKGKTVYVLMEKMLVNGLHTQQRYDAARKQGVKFIRIADRAEAGYAVVDGAVRITCRDAVLPATDLTIACDLLVIPEKVEPAKDNAAIAAIAAQALDAEGFLQSPNVRHRPIGSPRKGLFFAGTCHDEIDTVELAVEIRAIAAGLAQLASGKTPQEPAPVIREQSCARCLTCYRTCPHRAIVLQESNKPMIIPEACFACGLCVASCPAKAISQETFEDAALTRLGTDAHTIIFACERSALLAGKEAGRRGTALNKKIKIQPVKCAGRVSVETMLAPLLAGAQRVIVAGCHPGNCRSMDSGALAEKRLNRVCAQVHLSREELGFFTMAANEPEKFQRLVQDKE